MAQETFYYDKEFVLESGKKLSQFHLHYTTYGKINADKSNVIWVFHALTANSDPAEWWYGLVGEGKLINPEKYFIVCVNMPGSCYGSINPLDKDSLTGESFYHDFPLFTTRDMIRSYQLLKEHLNIRKIHMGIGGSMGGQQLLEWAIEVPEAFEYIIPIATNAKHSPWGVAFNASQRWCIENDITWNDKTPEAGLQGMKAARSIALLSYRNYTTYTGAQQGFSPDTEADPIDQKVFRSETYQHYQGEKLAKRFNAFSYYFLSRAMDCHDVGRGRGKIEEALQKIKAKAMVIGISSDLLFPPSEQHCIAANIKDAEIRIIESFYGHDGFLLEFEEIGQCIGTFIGK